LKQKSNQILMLLQAWLIDILKNIMFSSELRKKFLIFFAQRNHTIVASSSLLPNDATVLFTTAGMQQFKDYYVDKVSPFGPRVASIQKCFRTSDIEEVGDNRHLTFLEMLGNFSFGDYFKKEAISWAFEFLTKELRLPLSRIWITVFKGEKGIPEDKESRQIWLSLGIPEERIRVSGFEDNFWGPTGKEGPCGPTTEIHIDLRGKACEKGKDCQPNCSCERFIEVWNLVFNEYYKNEKGEFTLLNKKGVDTGMGLERLAMVVQNKNSVFETDIFHSLIEKVRSSAKNQENLERNSRIVVDHLRGIAFIAAEDILPSNVGQGYILRRLIRRVLRYLNLLNLSREIVLVLFKEISRFYSSYYPEISQKEAQVIEVFEKEASRFEKNLQKGLIHFNKLISEKRVISGREAFRLYDTFGFPLEMTLELAKEKGIKVEVADFYKAFKEHQTISRAGAHRKFGGVGIDQIKNEEERIKATKLHSATHLLQAALRAILGNQIRQEGSDITPERLRFDFNYPRPLTKEELATVENLVNEKIKEDLEVKREEMTYEEAINSGALAFFKEKYPPKVSVYSMGNFKTKPPLIFSKEICAGPHVQRTSEIGKFKILKQESLGTGLRRLKATVF